MHYSLFHQNHNVLYMVAMTFKDWTQENSQNKVDMSS